MPAVLGCVLVAGGSAMAQEIGAVRAPEPPTIDGVLDDGVWDSANVIDGFTQVDPVEGAEPSERTEVRVLFDDDAIYFSFHCYDSEPSRIVAKQMKREGSLRSDDHVTIVLDTFDDDRTGYMFEIGAAGGRRDGLIFGGGSTNRDWDGIWDGKARVGADGWTAEVAIPYKTVSFDPKKAQWGFNVQRRIARRQESVRWAGARRESSVRRVADAGAITGLTGMKQGYGLTIKPFVSAKADPDSDDVDFKSGLDVFYRLTPSTTIALTINTDFAETEVDQRRVNLTRFPLFFPEKRDFFLEDSSIFEFGGISRSPRPFHSRRIGIVSGEQKDILAGVRVTGRQDRVGFGLLDVQMKDDDELGSKNLGVGRVTLDVLDESSVGMIVTNGDPSERGSNTLVGTDFNFRKSDFDDASLSASIWAMGTQADPSDREGENSDASAVGGRASYDADPWELSFNSARIGEDFDPALGFVSARGRYEYSANVVYFWRPESSWLREVEFDFDARMLTDLDHEVDFASASLPDLGIEFESGDQMDMGVTWTRENPKETFEVVDGVELPPGIYDNWGGFVGFDSSTSRPVAVSGSVTYEGFYTGTLLELSGGFELRPSSSVFASFEYEQSEGDVDEGSFVVRVARTRATVLFSPDLSWDTTFQWDDESDDAGLNTRVRWEFEPGQEVFFVYNESFDSTNGRLTSTERQANFKVGLTWRF